MKPRYALRALGVSSVAALYLLGSDPSHGATDVYSTQFEAAQGYDAAYELVGQRGWLGDGTGGSGLISGVISGQGQHAYVGIWPPFSALETNLFVWQPLDFHPLAVGFPIVQFSVQMQILDSSPTNASYDNFRWSIYNTQGNRLFSLDFDNYDYDMNGSKYVSYLLDGTNALVAAEIRFTNALTYSLVVTMNFASNRWSATLNNALVTTNQPITTTSASLNLGEVDAVWRIYDGQSPGDNFMVFDNYQISAEAIAVPPPPRAQVQLLGRTAEGWVSLRVLGQHGSRWSVDATTNFTHWTALTNKPVFGASFDHVDTTATGLQRRFYRARWVP